MAQSNPNAPDVHLLCIGVAVRSQADPVGDEVARASFFHPLFPQRSYSHSISVTLGGQLPPPFTDWWLAEVNPAPSKNQQDYVVLRNDRIRTLAVLPVQGWDARNPQTRLAGPVVLRPSTRPTPDWPGIGCIYIDTNPLKNGDRRLHAELMAGEYLEENDLGWFHDDQLLPKPWDDWRVAKVFSRAHFHGPGSVESGVMLHNEKTGQDVEVFLKRVVPVRRATTHPSDDLIAAGQTGK